MQILELENDIFLKKTLQTTAPVVYFWLIELSFLSQENVREQHHRQFTIEDIKTVPNVRMVIF